MVAKGGRRRSSQNSHKEKHDAQQSDSSDEDESDEEEEEGPPLKFVLAGDDTGRGIDYNVLDQDSWQKLEEYCKKWGLKQAHLESIYSRFARTIARTEHLDFTVKPQFHASLDFLADEFMTTAGEFAAQIFIQTWFLRHKRGLRPPKDRRCIDFTRLVIMCCDLARLGDYELLANLWICVLHRFGGILPNGTINLDTRINIELVNEVITVLHANPDKKLDLLMGMLLAESEELDDLKGGSKSMDDHGMEETGGKATRYLTLRSVLRFSFQHPPLLFPVVQFQRVLRSKIIGSRYWLRRRKPASERGLSIRDLLSLPDTYHDVFDRIDSRQQAWTVASGHILLHALEPPPQAVTAAAAATAAAASLGKVRGSRGGGTKRGPGGDRRDCAKGGEIDGADREERSQQYDEQCRRLLDNCLPPPWYEVADEVPTAPTVLGTVAGEMIPALTVALTRFKANAKSLTSPKSAPASPLGGNTTTASATNAREDRSVLDTTKAPPGESLNDRSHSGRSGSRSGRSPSRRRRSRNHAPATTTIPVATAAPSPSPAPAAAAAAPAGTNLCAACLRRSSAIALCRRCGRRAAKAFKDDHGSRRARLLLVPYGASFGVGEPSALQREGDGVKRWVRLLDDETGAHFFYNAHYDSAVWKSGIETPQPAPVAKVVRRRKVGGGGGLVIAASPPNSGRPVTPPARPVAPLSPNKTNEGGASGAPRATGAAGAGPGAGAAAAAAAAAAAVTAAAGVASAGSTGRAALRKTRTMLSAASMAALHAAARGGTGANGPGDGGEDHGSRPTTPTIKPALKLSGSPPRPSSPENKAAAPSAARASPAGNRVVVLTVGDPGVVIDAHKRIYPPFRLVSWEEAEEAAAAAAAAAAPVTPGGMEGVAPGGGGLGLGRKSHSRGGSATPLDSARGRPSAVSRANTMKRAGTMSTAGATAAATVT